MGYRRELDERLQYQNTMSNGVAQGRVAIMLELRDVQQERQQQLTADLR